MKQVKNLIKLTNLNSEKLNEKELTLVNGGNCSCGCFYSNCGGSSSNDNYRANSIGDYISIFPVDQKEWNHVTIT